MATKDKKLRIGFVGTGFMGQCAHLRNYATIEGCEIVALAEMREDMGRRVGAKYGIPKVYKLASEMLAKEKLDGIVASQQFNRHGIVVSEILAAGLQARGALVMGEATTGKAAIFHEVPLSSGNVLRYATAHVYLANGTDLWDRPVVPDVTTTSDSQEEAGALALIDRQQVNAVISEVSPRHRMSEAALVRGQDPEQDAFIASHEQAAPAPQAPVTRDIALVEALDSFKAIRVLQGEESSPQPRVADTLSTAGQTVIASTGLGR